MPPRSFIPPILALAAICVTSVYKLAVQPRVDEIPVGFAEAALVQKTHIDGTPLRTRYTAVAPIDFLLSMLVAVFAPASPVGIPSTGCSKSTLSAKCLPFAACGPSRPIGRLIAVASSASTFTPATLEAPSLV